MYISCSRLNFFQSKLNKTCLVVVPMSNSLTFSGFKGIVSAQTISTYMIDWGSKINKNMFLSPSEADFSLNLSFLSKFLVIVVSKKWLPRSKTSQWKDVTVPKLVSEKWLPIQNSSVKSGYRSKSSQWKEVTDPNLVSRKWLPIQIQS